MALRSKLVLACALAMSNQHVDAKLRVNPGVVIRRRAEFIAGRFDRRMRKVSGDCHQSCSARM